MLYLLSDFSMYEQSHALIIYEYVPVLCDSVCVTFLYFTTSSKHDLLLL